MNVVIRYRYVFYILALLPVFIFRDFTPDNELKYISIVDEALRNGIWFVFHNHGAVYADKPPLYFWLMMLSRLAAGDFCMWLMGLFSLLPAAGTMMVMDRWMRLEKVRHNPIISNLMLGTTIMFIGSALVLRMDMMMTLFIVLSLYTFFRIYKGLGTPRDRWLLPVWLFLAVFSKGPMGILIPLVSVAGFLMIRRQLRNVGRWFGWWQLLILLGLCAAWFGAVYLEGGREYLLNILVKQTVGRGIDSFHHKEHLFFYFPRMLYTFAPWTLVYLAAIWLGVRRKLFATDTEKFFYTVVWTNIVMLSLVSSKLDIYMLPIYPFVAYLSSAMLSRMGGGRAAAVGVMIPAAALTLLWPLSFFTESLIPFHIGNYTVIRLGFAFASLGGLFALISAYRKKISQGIWYLSTGMMLMIFTAAFSIPQFNHEIGFSDMAQQAQQDAEMSGTEDYAYYNYKAFSDMDVFLGRQLREVSSLPQLDSLDAAPSGTILFLRTKDVLKNQELTEWLHGRPITGRINENYYWIVIGGNKTEQSDIETQ